MINKAEINGKVIYKSPLQSITTTTSKITVVVQYPNGNRLENVPIEFINPGNNLDNVQVDQQVLVSYIPTGNQSKTDPTKYFVGLKGLNIQIIH